MSYTSLIAENQNWIDCVWGKLDEKLSRLAVKSRDKIPYTTINGEHDNRAAAGADITWWTNGFWGGLMWLMYEGTKNFEYKATAERSEELLDGALERVDALHHDVGFLWHILSGANYRLTGNKKSRNRNLTAAMFLASRYNVKGNYIRCWNEEVERFHLHGKTYDQETQMTIIDCMMNLNLLYWASEEIKDDRFKNIAVCYADMAMRDHVRDDGSVNHIVLHSPNQKDTVVDCIMGQGYAKDSSWSRGVGWALYGFILSYIHTKEQRYLDTAIKVANHFITETEKTAWLPRLDFCQPEKPLYYDSTAGAIAACGLIELARYVDGVESEKYLAAAINVLKTMEENWCDWSESEDSILQMGSEAYTWGIHKPIIYGDYFFAEAIFKLKGFEFLPW